jgi:hypothetical protein
VRSLRIAKGTGWGFIRRSEYALQIEAKRGSSEVIEGNMLRILYAAIAGGVALQLWSAFSTVVLPWPKLAVGPLPPPPMTASRSISENEGEGEPQYSQSGSTTSNAVQNDGTPPAAFTRVAVDQLDVDARARGLAIDLVIGLLAALALLALPEQSHWSRKMALLIIAGAFAVLVGDLSQAAAMRWPLPYSAVVCVDHFGAVLSVATASSLVMYWQRPKSVSPAAA